MEISSQPWALFTFKALIIFIISSSLKSKEFVLNGLKIFDSAGVSSHFLEGYIAPQKTY